jgi:hypothetical protein
MAFPEGLNNREYYLFVRAAEEQQRRRALGRSAESSSPSIRVDRANGSAGGGLPEGQAASIPKRSVK